MRPPRSTLASSVAPEELGTTFVKLGQILSSRPDLLADVHLDELSGLVDDVPPVPFAELRPVIEGEVGAGVFAEIGEEPLAAASIAQIHPALLANGREVVVKVERIRWGGRRAANRIGAALIVVGLLVSSALMARVNDAVALGGFAIWGAIALYMV